MATIDIPLTTFNLPTAPADTEVETHWGTTSIVRTATTFVLPPRPRHHKWQLSWPINFCTMGDDTPIKFKARADAYPVKFCSAGVRRYHYINVFLKAFAFPSTARAETVTSTLATAKTIDETPTTFDLPSAPAVETEVT